MDPNQPAKQPPKQPPSNRLQLNFNFAGQGNFAGEPGRAFPTTPSTFPQPLPNNAGQQQELWGTNVQPNSGFTQSGYFMNSPYTSQMQQNANSLQAPVPTYRSQAPSQNNYNDAANGLVQQFAHQNLGNQPRTPSPYGRQPSPLQRPRPAGQGSSPGPQYGQFLGAAPPRNDYSYADEEPPMKNPQKFPTSIINRAKLQSELVGTFFKDSVERAKERNTR